MADRRLLASLRELRSVSAELAACLEESACVPPHMVLDHVSVEEVRDACFRCGCGCAGSASPGGRGTVPLCLDLPHRAWSSDRCFGAGGPSARAGRCPVQVPPGAQGDL